jgi:hypothetical protein
MERRPNSREVITKDFEIFLLDFENACLQDWPGLNWPRGNTRHLDPEWATYMKSQVYPNHSDVDWIEYCNWVASGGGDEWFY